MRRKISAHVNGGPIGGSSVRGPGSEENMKSDFTDIFAHVNWGPSGGSSARRPGSEDAHRS